MPFKPKYRFHGAFVERKKAQEKAKEVGGKIRAISIRGKNRYVVSTVE